MTNRIKIIALSLLLALLAGPALAAAGKPLLFQHPSLSRTQIVFAFAGDLWLTGRDGGPASRLTTGVGIESDPFFSPDGTLVAFSGQYDGNTDVFVVPAAGGIPRRLTHHPAADEVVGWKPDGKRVIFRSTRNSFSPVPALFTVGLDGGFPEELPLPTGVAASFSADGSRLAYVPTMHWQAAWKRYQGGQTSPIWIIDLSDLKVEKIPRENSNDSNPMWVGDKIYFPFSSMTWRQKGSARPWRTTGSTSSPPRPAPGASSSNSSAPSISSTPPRGRPVPFRSPSTATCPRSGRAMSRPGNASPRPRSRRTAPGPCSKSAARS
jgi:tricorn protease